MLVIVPSRGRPGNVSSLIGAWRDTAGVALLVIAVDEDDPALPEYRKLNLNPQMHLRVGRRLRLGGTLNEVATDPNILEFAGRQSIGFMGDDHRPRTQDWDLKIERALHELGAGVVYGNDLIQGPNLPTAAFISADIIRTLGYMVPPRLVHLYIDNAWKSLGEGMGRLTYLPDVVIEHMHPIAGKAEWDAGYVEVNSGEMQQADHDAYDYWVATGLPMDIIKLREAGLC